MTAQGLLERLSVVEDAAATTGGILAEESRLELRRAWPRRRGLTLEYLGTEGRKVAAQWRPDGDELGGVARSTGAHTDRPPSVVPAAGGEHVLLQPGGADRRLTGLAALARQPGARLLVHRPEQRAVVELPADGGRAFAKVLPQGRIAEARRGLLLARRLAKGRFAVPQVTAARPDFLVTAAVPGESLHDLLAEGRAAGAARRVGEALRDLHDASPAGLPRHSDADERALLLRWTNRLARYDAPLAEAIAARLAEVGGALAAGPASATVPLHRDLHDGQVLVDATGAVGLLDLDTLARGEAALDLANLLVHLELRVLQGLGDLNAASETAGAILEAYRPDSEASGRLGAYADATRLRLVAVYAFRPPFHALAPELLSTVGRPLLAGLGADGAHGHPAGWAGRRAGALARPSRRGKAGGMPI